MINRFTVITFFYYVNLLVVNGIYPIQNNQMMKEGTNGAEEGEEVSKVGGGADDEVYRNLERFDFALSISQELIELVYILSVLIIFRAREWPERFEATYVHGDGYNLGLQPGLMGQHYGGISRTQY